jgi:hypothetical protein
VTYFLAGELDALRLEYESSLDRTCTVSTPGTPSTDEYGNTTNTPSTASSVPCAFMATAGNEKLVGGAIAQVGNYVLRFKWDRALTPKMSVAVDVSGSLPAKTFQLVAPLDHGTPIGQRWLATES